jgi:sterol desaturase/sphingolipid hydroxylase (fatty acid hydroxylase superfamily)
MSMHPIEHILYFSGILIHWVIPSHPLIAMFHIFHAGIAPTAGHTGYEKMVFKNGKYIQTGDYNHYLHHKYFECNYSGGNVSFLDKLFGTFHDGSEEATQEVMKRLKNKSYL